MNLETVVQFIQSELSFLSPEKTTTISLDQPALMTESSHFYFLDWFEQDPSAQLELLLMQPCASDSCSESLLENDETSYSADGDAQPQYDLILGRLFTVMYGVGDSDKLSDSCCAYDSKEEAIQHCMTAPSQIFPAAESSR